MRRFLFGIAASAAIALSTSARAQDDFEQRFYARVGDWQVRKLKTAHAGCHTYRSTPAGNLYGMTYGQNRAAMLSFTLPNVVTKGRTTRELEIRFVGGAAAREQTWGKHDFNAVEMDSGGTIFLSGLVAVNILDAFAASSALRVYADGQLFAALPLDGAGPAIAKLRECAAAVAAPAR